MVAMLVEDQLLEAGASVLGPAPSLAAALAHRGPDDEGTFREGRIGLAHRRLAVMDPTPAGHQPISNEAAVLDVNLRGESVVPLADALARRGVPFLFMTGYGDTDGLGSHARVPVLAKPFDPLELVVVLARLLRRAKAAG